MAARVNDIVDERAVEILESAADLIVAHGHRKGGFGSKHLGFCALGAMLEAKHRKGFTVNPYDRARTWLIYHLEEEFGPSPAPGPVSNWNDSAVTEADDVIHELRMCAKKIKESM